MTGSQIDNLSALADEYVLGLLEGAEKERFEARIEEDASLQAEVAKSRDRFVELDLAGRAEPVRPELWGKLEKALNTEKPLGHAGENRASPPAANDNRLGFWRRTAFGSIAASLLLLMGFGFLLINQPEPEVIAILMNDKGEPLVLVEDFGNAKARITPVGDFNVPPDRSLQVWTLPSKEMGPTSLGLLDGWHTALLDTAALPEPRENQLYEITLEQPGGSPTGRPTGPILVKGFARTPR